MPDELPPDVTDKELEVLRLLWAHGERTRRQVTDALYPAGGPAHYHTVQKLLERLEGKGFVASTLVDGQRVFTALVGRDLLIRRRLRAVAETLCDGSLTPILTNLVDASALSADEVAALRALVRKLGKA